MTEHTGFIDRIRRDPALAQFFEHRAYFLMEYDPVRDELTVYDCLQQSLEVLPGYLSAALPERTQIFAEDRWQMHALLTGELNGPLELRFQAADGTFLYRELDARPLHRTRSAAPCMWATPRTPPLRTSGCRSWWRRRITIR